MKNYHFPMVFLWFPSYPSYHLQVTRLTLTSSGSGDRGAAEDDEEDEGPRSAADRRREVQEELERAWERVETWGGRGGFGG